MSANLARNIQPRLPDWLLVVLHLAPGIVIAGFFFALSKLFIQNGLTGYLALLVTIPACVAPLEIGVMLFWSARSTGRVSLASAITYRQRGTAVDYIVLPLLLFVVWGVLSLLTAPALQNMDMRFTSWLPNWATQQALIAGLASSSPAQRGTALIVGVFLSGLLAPIVEELYFRGFLLPRMAHWGWLAPVFNALLFALYHFYFPENLPGIFLAFYPIAYVVRRKQDWRIGAITHMLFNLMSVFSLSRMIA